MRHRPPAVPLLVLITAAFCLIWCSRTASAFSLLPQAQSLQRSACSSIGTRGGHGAILRAKKSSASDDDKTATYLIHSHHLLDHKPDNLVLSGRKFKLKGIAVLGRPGVALCVGTPSNADKFLGKLRKAMPQKKFVSSRLEVEEELPFDGFERGTMAELREAMTRSGNEDRFLSLVGVDSGQGRGGGVQGSSEGDTVGKKKSREKKGRKRK